MLVELFLVGTFWFWILVGLTSLILFALVDYERPGWATSVLILTLALLYFFGDFNAFAYAREKPLHLLGWFGGYLAAGTIWSFVKWGFFLWRKKDEYNDLREAFLRDNGVTNTEQMPEKMREKWIFELAPQFGTHHRYNARSDFLKQHGRYRTDDSYTIPDELRDEWQKVVDEIAANINIRPLARENKNRILLWMVYWPWSMVWTIINDPIKRAFKWIYRRVQAIYEWMAERVFSGVEADFRPTAPKAGNKPKSD